MLIAFNVKRQSDDKEEIWTVLSGRVVFYPHSKINPFDLDPERKAHIQDERAAPTSSYGRPGLPCGGGAHRQYGVPCDRRSSPQQNAARTERSPRRERRRSRNSRPQTPSRPEPDASKEADYSSVPMAGFKDVLTSK